MVAVKYVETKRTPVHEKVSPFNFDLLLPSPSPILPSTECAYVSHPAFT